MSNYISLNFQYFKQKASMGVLAHNTRRTSPDYLLPEPLRLPNYIEPEIYQNLQDLIKKSGEILQRKGTGWRSNSIILLDGVVAFGETRMDEIISDYGIDETHKILAGKLDSLMTHIEAETGMTRIGKNIHFDEGFADSYDNSKAHRNIHAHISFINFDFSPEKERTVLRYLPRPSKANPDQKVIWHLFQDFAEAHFKDIGFKRGRPKLDTHREHLSPSDYKELLRLKTENERLSKENERLKKENIELAG